MSALVRFLLFWDLCLVPITAKAPITGPAWGSAWPHDAAGELMSCKYTTILSDVATKWPGNCDGLTQQTMAAGTAVTAATCSAQCKAKAKCNVWLISANDLCSVSTNYYAATNCWSGSGAAGAGSPKAGQRLQHGEVKVKATLKNAKYSGLKVLGLFYSTTDKAASIDRCRKQCYSDVTCGVWQYDAVNGCEVQNKEHPPTPGSAAATMPAGEYEQGEVIEHQCLPPKATKTGIAEKSSNIWIIILIAVVVGVIALVVIYFLCFHESSSKPRKATKTRSVKVAERKAEQPLMQMVAVPMQTQPVMAYAAPPVQTYAQPVQTYAAAPQYQMVPQGPVVQPLASSLAVIGGGHRLA